MDMKALRGTLVSTVTVVAPSAVRGSHVELGVRNLVMEGKVHTKQNKKKTQNHKGFSFSYIFCNSYHMSALYQFQPIVPLHLLFVN